ncbi:hypothetical protein B0H17DRAFT_1064042 [Mycena rosella]|uniref:Uncharacterized protein n=1 Tax=Mycena rosella TaxID=1033263 RepID=A0AAD7GIM7_MYCRO|nr:hypothetical protein B0H17DRAFT_1064042 [Mycena rosella]
MGRGILRVDPNRLRPPRPLRDGAPRAWLSSDIVPTFQFHVVSLVEGRPCGREVHSLLAKPSLSPHRIPDVRLWYTYTYPSIPPVDAVPTPHRPKPSPSSLAHQSRRLYRCVSGCPGLLA